MWFKKGYEIIRNKPASLIENLDELPVYEYDFRDHYVLENNTQQPMSVELYRQLYGDKHLTITSRGCPFSCTYCINSVYRKIYLGQQIVRTCSNESAIKELEVALSKIPDLRAIGFEDDSFLAKSVPTLADFCDQYKKRIGLPFSIITISIFRKWELIDMLYDAGLRQLHIGLQSGSPRVLKEVYRRPLILKETKEFLEYLTKFKDLEIYLDVIVDNPWEEDEDRMETVKFLLKCPRNFKVTIFSLKLFQGTQLYDRAIKEGVDIEQNCNKPYSVFRNNYFTSLIILLVNFHFPKILLNMLINPKIYKAVAFGPIYYLLNRTSFVMYLHYMGTI
jgi:radical SAM superfamily enzyme YgiQ (UPF0313 family)